MARDRAIPLRSPHWARCTARPRARCYREFVHRRVDCGLRSVGRGDRAPAPAGLRDHCPLPLAQTPVGAERSTARLTDRMTTPAFNSAQDHCRNLSPVRIEVQQQHPRRRDRGMDIEVDCAGEPHDSIAYPGGVLVTGPDRSRKRMIAMPPHMPAKANSNCVSEAARHTPAASSRRATSGPGRRSPPHQRRTTATAK